MATSTSNVNVKPERQILMFYVNIKWQTSTVNIVCQLIRSCIYWRRHSGFRSNIAENDNSNKKIANNFSTSDLVRLKRPIKSVLSVLLENCMDFKNGSINLRLLLFSFSCISILIVVSLFCYCDFRLFLFIFYILLF